MSLAAWLIAMAGPLVIRVLATLGMTIVTFTGVKELVLAMISNMQAHWASIPSAMLGLLTLAGLPEALSMICAGFAARVTLWAAMSATKLLFKSA